MVIHACVFSQALFSTELHWRTKLYASAITSEHLSCSLLTSAELSLSHTWLYSALTRYDSSSALFDATPACPHTLSGPVLHTYVSDSSTQSPDALFSIVLKPPAGVFSTTDRRFFDHRPATDRLPTGYRRLPTGYRRLPTGYRRLPTGYRRLPTGYRRLPTGYRRLPTGYRRLPTGYRRLPPATDRLPPATDRLPTGYRRLPSATDRLSSATADYRRLPTGYRRLPTGYRRLPTGYRRLPTDYRPATAGSKKKKKKFFFLTPEECHSCSLQTEFPIWRLGDADRAQKFSGHVLQNEDCMCVSLYIYGH